MRAKPLIFLNACHSARQGFALTNLDGWAQRFIEAGASAFVGTLWEINDELASKFAIEFYNRLRGIGNQKPRTLGEAFQEARLVIRDLDPANPTWMSYVLYGNPYAEVIFSGAE